VARQRLRLPARRTYTPAPTAVKSEASGPLRGS